MIELTVRLGACQATAAHAFRGGQARLGRRVLLITDGLTDKFAVQIRH